MSTSFLRCVPVDGAPFKLNHESEVHISKTEGSWVLYATSMSGIETTIRVFEKQTDAEYTRACLKSRLSNRDEYWDAQTFKSLSDAWREAAEKLSDNSLSGVWSGAAEKLSDDQNVQNVKSLMKSSKLVITNGEAPIKITIKYPCVCEDWGDLLQEYQQKIECSLSLGCAYIIEWEGASLEFQEYDRQKPDDLSLKAIT